jgi:alpha-galactosidase
MKLIYSSLLLVIFASCSNHKKNSIENNFFQLSFPLKNEVLWCYTLKETGERVDIAPPAFEVDGKKSIAIPKLLELVNSPDTLKNGVVEYKFISLLKNDSTLSLQITFRISKESPVIRFFYTLMSRGHHTLTKSNGKDSLSYFSTSLQKYTTFSEIQLSEFNEMSHSFVSNQKTIEQRYFRNNQCVTGPILLAENNQSTFLFAYEHGSQLPDRFIDFQLAANKNIVLKAVKGNYYNLQPLNSAHPFETIWFEMAGVKGNSEKLAKQYRNFILKDITVNQASRTPYIYYNTWGFQERDKSWNGNKYLSSMNLDHALREIKVAHRMGIDVFVLDAGWFGKTGDWKVNTNFFPDSLQRVKATLDSLNMKLGLWYSPTQAAVTSKIYMQNKNSIASYNGELSQPLDVWETESSYTMCMVNKYWKDCAGQMILSAQKYGNIYFKWDAIAQYGCNAANHNHGTVNNTEQERLDCYAFELGRYLNKVVDSVSSVIPNAIVDFDITEGWRSMGLQFLASGKFFIMNNGPYYENYNLPQPENMLWNNIFVHPGAARAAICRTPLAYDQWIPSILFLTHYLPDAPQTSQTINVGSLILGQNGFWGDVLNLSDSSENYIGALVEKYKQVKTDITLSYPITSGNSNSSPEVHEKIYEKNGRGVVVIFSMAAIGHTYTYITQNTVDQNIWHTEDVSITYDAQGKAVITCSFNDEAAKIIFFGVKNE